MPCRRQTSTTWRTVPAHQPPNTGKSTGKGAGKGASIGDLHHDPDRLRQPHVRRPDGSHEAVGWDEALAEVELEAGRAVEVVVEFAVAPNASGLATVRVTRPHQL